MRIGWAKKKNAESPYFVEVPDTLKSLSFIGERLEEIPEHARMGVCQV